MHILASVVRGLSGSVGWVFCKRLVLLRHYLPRVKFTNFRCVLNVFGQIYALLWFLTQLWHSVSITPESSHMLLCHSFPPNSPAKLSPSGDCSSVLPFLEFHINGFMRYVVFCAWLLSLSIMMLTYMQVVSRIGSSFFLIFIVLFLESPWKYWRFIWFCGNYSLKHLVWLLKSWIPYHCHSNLLL